MENNQSIGNFRHTVIGHYGLVWMLCLICVFGQVNAVVLSDVVVPVGHFVHLDCFVSTEAIADFYIVQWKRQGSLGPVLLWRRGQVKNREGKGYEGRVQVSTHTAALSIVDLRSTDGGHYDCQTWSVNGQPIGNATSTFLQLIDDIPKWTRQPESVVVSAGGLAEFHCDTDPPAASVVWQRNGQTLVNSTKQMTIHRSKLVVKVSSSEQVQGVYQCSAVWLNAALLSTPANLTIAVIRPFQQHDQVNLTTQVGGNAVLPGYMPLSLPAATPMVTHNGVPITHFDGRKLLLASGNLHIQKVSQADEGLYRFSALNHVTGENVTAKHSVLLRVLVAEKTLSPQLLAAQQDRNVLTVGKNVTLECAANGHPAPNISWSKYGGILPVGRHKLILGNLLLTDLHTNDTGTYICEADNGISFPVSSISTLDVIEEPKILNWVAEYETGEGEELVLDCTTNLNVNTRWTFNGTNVSFESVVLKGSKLCVSVAQRHHAGFYQCFAFNKAGVVMSTARVRVVPKAPTGDDASAAASPRPEPPILIPDSNWGQTTNGSNGESDSLDFSDRNWQESNISNRRRNKKKGKKTTPKNGSNRDSKVVMIPPTRPEVTKLSDESVMVRWDVPPNSGLQIQFFKVQYRVIAKHTSRWMTIDEDIPPHILSYEVPNLRTGHTYRFRIAAVYSNNDNKLGPNSHRFTLQKDSPMKKPVVGPTIISTETISPSAIAIRWQYLDIEEVPIEGFFIYYRATTSAGTYTKVTVLGANTPSHIISHLLPDTSYDVKMQCFNSAGTSDFSNIHTEKTFAFLSDDEEETENDVSPIPSPNTSDNNQLLYIVLGTVLGTLVIMLALFVTYCLCKQKRHRIALNTNHIKENGESQEMGQYTAANTSATMANGHGGLSTSIFLWHTNVGRHPQAVTTNVEEASVDNLPHVLDNSQEESGGEVGQKSKLHESMDDGPYARE